MKTRKCGCITYEYGPPHICQKHQKKEERGLRQAVRDQAEGHGHKLSAFSEYESQAGKWTAYCEDCCYLVIVYDEPQPHLDQINGPKILEKACRHDAVRM